MPNENAGAIHPTLFLGLGGTGKEVLLRLRRKFYERLRKPGLPCTSYLWIDTDTRDLDARGQRMDEIFEAVRFRPADEQIGLLNGKVGGAFADIFDNQEQFRHIHEWLYPEVNRFGAEISDGAGGIRAVGRLTFFHHYATTISERIRRSLKQLSTQDSIQATKELFRSRGLGAASFADPPIPQVFVVCSLAGGTGCGTLLDTAFHLRLLNRLEDPPIEKIIGMVFLPNVYYGSNKGEKEQRSYANTYAALKEIEYYSLRAPNQDISVDFLADWEGTGQKKRIQGPPFSVMYLQEMTNEAGISLDTNNRSEMFSMVAESLFSDFMPGPFSTAKRSDYSNVAHYVSSTSGADISSGGVALPQNFSRRYASFGMSKIEIPVDAIQGACAAELAGEILDYINRDPRETNVRTDLPNDMADSQLDARGLEDRFGSTWKETIDNELAALLQGQTLRSLSDVDKLENQLVALEDKLVRSDTPDPLKWGTVISTLRKTTPAVTAAAQEASLAWLRDRCLENDVRGLKVLLADDGYLFHMTARLKGFFESPEGSLSEFDGRVAAGEEDAQAYLNLRTSCLDELRTVLKNLGAAILVVRTWTVTEMLKRLKEAEDQYLKAKACVCLYQEVKKVARAVHDSLIDKRKDLVRFLQAVGGYADSHHKKSREFLSFGKEVLFIRLFDRDKDWPHFYKLGLDEMGQPATVNRRKEYQNFLEQSIAVRASLLDLIGVFTKLGEPEFRKRLDAYCEERFWRDFASHPRLVNVLEHPRMVERESDNIEQLLRAARPMLRQRSALGRQAVNVQRSAYLGVENVDEEPWRGFVARLRQELQGAGYSLDAQSTGRPWEIYLYMVNFAFPLPAVQIVAQDCHNAYQEFYRNLRSGAQMKEQGAQIPLHLSRKWEGKFNDLVVYTEEEAGKLKEARDVLLFGSMLKVLTVNDADGQIEYGYKRGAPLYGSFPLGRKREAIELLRSQESVRQMLQSAITQREAQLTNEQCKTYYWGLQSLNLSGEFVRGVPEHTLLERKLIELSKNLKGRGIPDSDISLDLIPDAERTVYARRCAGNTLEWTLGVPILKDLEGWLKPAEAGV